MGIDPYPEWQLRTSVTQLRNFLLMYMNYGEYNSTIILDNDTVELMLTPQLSFSQIQGIIWLNYSTGRPLWGHEGSRPGCQTFMLFNPETNIGVIVLTNGEPHFNDLAEITIALFELADAETPYKPDIYGPPNGKPGTEYEYTFNAVDPDGDNVKYHIDWDDSNSDTTVFSSSGTNVKVKHTWSTQGTYIIKAKAVDIHGAESDWAELSVSMPRNRAVNTPFLQFLQNFLQQYPILYQLLLRFLRL